MNIFQNIRIRLTLWYLLIVAILVTFSGGVAYILLSDSLSRRTIDPWDIRTATMLPQSDSGGLRYTISNVSEIAPQLGIYSSTEISYIKVFTRQELLKMADPNGIITFKAYGDAIVAIDQNMLLTLEMTDAHFIWFYLPNSSLNTRVLIVTQSAYNMNQTLSTFRQALLLTSLVTVILAGILGFFLINRMLHPVQAITRTAREIQENNLSQRLDVQAKDELGSLATTLNQTFSRLEAAFIREREFTADASHELRTPLAIAQGEATLALKEERSREEYQKALESISRQLSRTSSLINRLLFLARSDDRLELVLTEIDLTGLMSETAQDARILCESKHIVLDWQPENNATGIKVKGDVIRLRELFLNLLENAVRYTPEGGRISLSVDKDSGYARIAVSDTGVGIPAEHLPHIFERFYRVDKSRSRSEGGAGLGLAISRRIAEVHGGRIEVASEAGKGSTFTVFLPLGKADKS
jgi:heavy metal sensor kinase